MTRPARGSRPARTRGQGRPGDVKASRVRGWLRRNPQGAVTVTETHAPSVVAAGPELDLASNDPLVGYLLSAASAVDITGLQLQSPALQALKQAGVVLVVPLISSGSLVGLLSLGPRRSERGYSTDDLRLLNSLAGYAAPAMRVGQLVRQQQAEARQRERIEQELKIAQIIQQQFLPKSLPDLPSWHVAAFYRPARTVGGDFYDFIPLPDGRVMFVVGDVTDKGIPAALVMASTHALLRDAAPRLISPGQVLGHVNDMLCVDIPAHMFVTCLALVLDPVSGQIEFANAGHDVPYVRTRHGVQELRARGMPLGLMPGMDYEEKTLPVRARRLRPAAQRRAGRGARARPGDVRLPAGLGAGRQGTLGGGPHRPVPDRARHLHRTGSRAGRRHHAGIAPALAVRMAPGGSGGRRAMTQVAPRRLDTFTLASEPGNERLALARVAGTVKDLGLSDARLERLKTAVAEATMNAIEHGNGNRPEIPVEVEVTQDGDEIIVAITDQGGRIHPDTDEHEEPDLVRKLDGDQSPRGWGLFLIRNMVDAMDVTTDGQRHTIWLTMRTGGAAHDERM